MRVLRRIFLALAATATVWPALLSAQCLPGLCTGNLPAGQCGLDDARCVEGSPSNPPGCAGAGCNFVNNCRTPEVSGPTFEVAPQGGGTYRVRLQFDVRAWWNDWASEENPNGTLDMFWAQSPTATACVSALSICEYLGSDHTQCYLEQSGLTCAGAPYDFGTFSFRAEVCGGGCFCEQNPFFCQCWRKVDRSGIPFVVTKGTLGCPVPPPSACPRDNACQACIGAGGGGASPGGGGGGWSGADTGPKATLRYLAGGAGGPGWPGTAAWTPSLGRYWSHDYAERIVPDPDQSHVWLITRNATFREFGQLSGGVYQFVAPSDEERTLTKTASGWELEDLDGTVQRFDTAGLWTETVDRNGNAKTATYNAGRLASVAFPDGRSETFAYHPDGKLASITEVGVGGAASRTWSYTWTGDDLTQIARPDGTAWGFYYTDAGHPGYLTRVDLIGTDLSGRVDVAFEYDAQGNVARMWRGDPSPTGPNAIESQTLTYTNPTLPTAAEVTDSFGRVTTYTIGRDTVGRKPRMTRVEGDCPACGSGPNVELVYGDAANPLKPTQETDARGTITSYTYDAHGQTTVKTEATNVAGLQRTTAWSYSAAFPAFALSTTLPSTSGAGSRVTANVYEADGDLESRTISGTEAGASFSLTTVMTYNAAGQVLTIDPPGFAAVDQTSFTYDASRGNLIPLTRTDPLVGTTTFAYDAFNRRTEVTDPNEVKTVTAYDLLNRVTAVTQQGATAPEDLVTNHAYNVFGDLFRTTLPRGNVVEYGYDFAGRLVSVERKPDATTSGERTLYTLDAVGHRTREELQRWDGAVWVTDSSTDFVYTSRCQLDKVILAPGSPVASTTEYAYDCNGNLEKVWDANHPKGSNPNPTQLYAYDALDRLTSVTVGPGTGTVAATGYTYDVQDHLASVTDAEANATTYTTSDRDLLTQQVSPVSGTTISAYNEHGELLTTTDARSIVAERTVDAADRVTQETFGPAGSPDPTLTTTYAYGSTPAQFNVGRLTGITRNSQTIAYTYDRFGRVLQDGSLTYEVDKNGNRTKVTYPENVSATYTHDFADREATLSVGPQPLVTSAAYKALGPLTNLSLANGLTETRLFDARYFPDRIQAGSLLDWDYTVDAVGNPTAIAGTIIGTTYSPSFAYQDNLYFLTQGNGPWGNRTWTYDKIGNRLTFARASEPTLSYTYAGTGHNPKLTTVGPAPGWGTGSWSHSYDAAGNQTQILESNNEGPVQTTFYDVAADSRMSALHTGGAGPSRTDFLYDGRGFLRQAHLTVTPPGDSIRTTPVYSSDGVLMARTEERQWTGATTGGGEDMVATVLMTDTTQLFYFAGRPAAQLTTGPELLYLTTDHLGTPVLATDASGAAVWAGGVEPFGATWTAGPDNPDVSPSTSGGLSSTTAPAISRLSSERVFLRYPGQWASDAFRVTSTQQDLYYNLARFYDTSTGRYAMPDPLGIVDGDPHPYAYVLLNPIAFSDPFGLAAVCCRLLNSRLFGNVARQRHCYVKADDGTVYGLYREVRKGRTVGVPRTNDPKDKGGTCKDCECIPGQDQNKCLRGQFNGYPVGEYRVLGPNSNTFAGTLAEACCKGGVPDGLGSAPGIGDNPPSPAPPSKP